MEIEGVELKVGVDGDAIYTALIRASADLVIIRMDTRDAAAVQGENPLFSGIIKRASEALGELNGVVNALFVFDDDDSKEQAEG